MSNLFMTRYLEKMHLKQVYRLNNNIPNAINVKGGNISDEITQYSGHFESHSELDSTS